MASREKEVMLKILEVYREMPFLWNKRHEDYKNSRSRHKGQQILLDIYKMFDPNATIQTLIKRIHNLRSYYVAEHKKVKESIRNGGVIYVPHIYYYDAFSFLEPFMESTRDTKESEQIEPVVTINTDDDASTILSAVKNQAKEIIQEMLINSPSSSLHRKYFKGGPEENKRSKTSGANVCNLRSNTLRNKTRQNEIMSASSDEFQIFGMYITTQLESLSEEQSLIAREKIQTILFECRLQDLKRKNASSENDATSTDEIRNVNFVSVDSNAKKTKNETDSDSDTDILKDNFIVQIVATKGDACNVDSQSSL